MDRRAHLAPMGFARRHRPGDRLAGSRLPCLLSPAQAEAADPAGAKGHLRSPAAVLNSWDRAASVSHHLARRVAGFCLLEPTGQCFRPPSPYPNDSMPVADHGGGCGLRANPLPVPVPEGIHMPPVITATH